MNCHDARELFSALLDEALTPDERARLDEHLAACSECGRELDGLRRTVALVQGLPSDHAPPGFVERVTAAAHPEPWLTRLARGLLVPWRLKLPLEAAALLLVAGLAVLVFRGTEEQRRAAQVAGPPPTSVERPTVLERPADQTPEVATRAAEPPAPRQDQALTATQNRAPSPARPSPGAPAEPRASTVPPAAARPQRLARPPASAPPTSAPGLRDRAAPPGAAPSTREGMEQSLDAATGSASEPDAGTPARRESARGNEQERRQEPGAAEAPVSGGAAAEMQAPSKLSDGGAREREVQEGVAHDLRGGRLGSSRSRTEPDIRGSLTVADARAAAVKVEDIARRLDGVVVGQRHDGDTLLVQVAVGRPRYNELIGELTRLGQWRTETDVESSSLPMLVRVTIRVVEPQLSR